MLTVDEKVLADIGRGFSVPPQPKLLLELRQLITSKESDINKIADTIVKDVSVSAMILKTINSPVYGLSRSISDIHKAARYIGIQGVLSLVTNTLIRQSFDQNDCSIALEEFWDNASNIADACVVIGRKVKQPLSADKLFSIGLFHDCGIPVMASKFSDYTDTYEHALQTPSETLTDIEESVYQVNHATIGYYVASSWRLPKDICQIVLSHHDRQFLEIINHSSNQFYFAVLKMAENIVHNHKYFRDSADWEYVKDSVFTLLDFDEDDLSDLMEDCLT